MDVLDRPTMREHLTRITSERAKHKDEPTGPSMILRFGIDVKATFRAVVGKISRRLSQTQMTLGKIQESSEGASRIPL